MMRLILSSVCPFWREYLKQARPELGFHLMKRSSKIVLSFAVSALATFNPPYNTGVKYDAFSNAYSGPAMICTQGSQCQCSRGRTVFGTKIICVKCEFPGDLNFFLWIWSPYCNGCMPFALHAPSFVHVRKRLIGLIRAWSDSDQAQIRHRSNVQKTDQWLINLSIISSVPDQAFSHGFYLLSQKPCGEAQGSETIVANKPNIDDAYCTSRWLTPIRKRHQTWRYRPDWGTEHLTYRSHFQVVNP